MFMRDLILLLSSTLVAVSVNAQQTFSIVIQRDSVKAGLVYGDIYVNDEHKHIGRTYENDTFKINPGIYKGLMRYNSGKDFVQSPVGALSTKGDFLLEVSGVKGRTDILFHPGNKPHHSQGCILLGPANTGPDGAIYISENHPLRKLRLMFYGTDDPISSPNVKIQIEIKDIIEETRKKTATPSDIFWDCLNIIEVTKMTSCNTRNSYAVKLKNNCSVDVFVYIQYESEEGDPDWYNVTGTINKGQTATLEGTCFGTGRFLYQAVEMGTFDMSVKKLSSQWKDFWYMPVELGAQPLIKSASSYQH